MLGEQVDCFILINLDTHKTFIVLQAWENVSSLSSLHTAWNSTFKHSVDKILIENSPTSVFQKPRVLAL